MKLQNRSGFSLIELLVVITIIGILATGAVTLYTSQIQKARDTTRINDIKAVQSAVEQVYQDSGEYPHSNEFATGSSSGRTGVKTYMERIPEDPKQWQGCNEWTACDYLYIVWIDNNSVTFGEYELSNAFENDGNVQTKAVDDGWNDAKRFESWIDIWENDTWHSWSIDADGCQTIDWAAPGNTSLIVLGPEC